MTVKFDKSKYEQIHSNLWLRRDDCPYTEEEELDLYRRSVPTSMTRPCRPPSNELNKQLDKQNIDTVED